MSSQGTALDIAFVRANDLTFTATATTSAHDEGATMTTAQQADEIDSLRVLMAHYERGGTPNEEWLTEPQ